VGAVEKIPNNNNTQVYAKLSRVSFWGIPFINYQILFPPPELKDRGEIPFLLEGKSSFKLV
jgi:hypothetical protein